MSKPRPANSNGDKNKLLLGDRPAHAWYRFILSFPPHLVRDYLHRFDLHSDQTVLDPFCGTGTVLVEAKRLGIRSVGVEANPMAHFASSVKIDWSPEPQALLEHAHIVARAATERLAESGIEDTSLVGQSSTALLRTLPPEADKLLLANSISTLPLHKSLVLRDTIGCAEQNRYYGHEALALATTVVNKSSNLHFGPEVGVSPPKIDAPVIQPWLSAVTQMVEDLKELRHLSKTSSSVILADSREFPTTLERASIDAVITSPPYPNEKDYTRTTRLESVLLGFFTSLSDVRSLKRRLVRSNTRSIYKGDNDDEWARMFPAIQVIADKIEARRIELHKTSGFERLYARVTRLYFGGMARHLAALRSYLRPGAQLAYVVGDQASYLQVMIPTGQLLADIAMSLGYELVGIDLFRTRLATATRQQLREEVLLLRWPGS